MKTQEFEISFYVDGDIESRLDETGVVAASVVLDSESHCTADIREEAYTITMVFSAITKGGLLMGSVDACVSIGAYRKEAYKLQCKVFEDYYTYLVIDKKDVGLWGKTQ